MQVGGKALGEPVAESYAFVKYRPSVDEMRARPWLLHQLGRVADRLRSVGPADRQANGHCCNDGRRLGSRGS